MSAASPGCNPLPKRRSRDCQEFRVRRGIMGNKETQMRIAAGDEIGSADMAWPLRVVEANQLCSHAGRCPPLIMGSALIMTYKSIYGRSEEHTSELQSLMRISYAVFCLKKKKHNNKQ